MILVSACLAGVACRYDGKANTQEEIVALVKAGKAMAVCPEVLGGLETPRHPCEQVYDPKGQLKIINNQGQDCTAAFEKGAEITCQIAKLIDADTAVLKQRSPSCGCGKVYDGSFSGRLIEGDGLAAQKLKKMGIRVLSEETLDQL